MDPKSRFDVDEGEKEWKRQKENLMSKLTLNNTNHPSYQQHVDSSLGDCNWTEEDKINDQRVLEVWRILLEYRTVFSPTPKMPDQTTTTEHAIILEGDTPQSPAMYRRSPKDEALIEEWVNWMLEHGLISHSDSKFAQNLLIVRKPGKEPRFCLDPRPVNAVTKPDQYPTPRIDAIFSRLLHSKVFSTLDAARSGRSQ